MRELLPVLFLVVLLYVVIKCSYPYTKRESKTCPICDGLGFMTNRYDSYEGHPCHHCQGSGHV